MSFFVQSGFMEQYATAGFYINLFTSATDKNVRIHHSSIEIDKLSSKKKKETDIKIIRVHISLLKILTVKKTCIFFD